MSKKISEILIEKTVHRPVKDEYGNRYYEERTFLMKYNPAIESHFPRAWAKVTYLLVFFIPLLRFGYEFWPGLGIVLVMIYGALAEWKTGQTLGKWLMGLKVIDDDGNYPNLWLSIKRNTLSILNLTPLPGTRIAFPVTGEPTFRYNMNLNNRLCHTYIVYAKKLSEIKELQNKKGLPE